MPSAVKDAPLSGRLLLVSNRLPITIKRSENGEYSTRVSSGGLVTGLSGLSKSTKFQWYGWPGLEVPASEQQNLAAQLQKDEGAIPIFIDDELADRHYNGFSSALMCYHVSLRANSVRFHPLASFSLPSRRDHIRRVRMVSIQRSQQTLCEDSSKGCPGWRPYLGPRLPSYAASGNA